MIGSAGRRHMPPTESYAADMLNAALAYASPDYSRWWLK
jgi:hypothetical protein